MEGTGKGGLAMGGLAMGTPAMDGPGLEAVPIHVNSLCAGRAGPEAKRRKRREETDGRGAI